MHITFLALSPTWWIVGTLVFFVLALIVSLLLIRLYIVDQRVMNTTDKWLRDARAQRDRLNKERDEAIERYVKNEADLLRDKTKLSGQVKELQKCIKALEDEKTRILQDEGYISVASVQAEKLYKTISALTAENAEQHEMIAERDHTIKQQQQIIDDLKIECQRILAQRDDGSRLSAQKPAPRKGGKP